MMKFIDDFIEYFDICGPGGATIESILKKKHSERSLQEKKILRDIVKSDKKSKPKIKIPEPWEGHFQPQDIQFI